MRPCYEKRPHAVRRYVEINGRPCGPAVHMPPISELPGSMAGRFRLVQRLGGPRSSVWKAEDPDTKKGVVIRVLTRSLPPDRARRAALLERVRQRALFHHPGFPAIDSIWIEGDALLLCEELVEGTSLARSTRPLSEHDALKLAWQLADALRTLHSRRIVHGALDPERIVVQDGFRITGISLAALTAREDRGEERLLHSTDPAELRKLSFRAPEQISSRGSEVRSDVFSLGALLYEATTGMPPFAGANATEIANAILRGSPRSPLELNPRLPIGVIAVVGKCLMKDPVKRFQDMQQVLEELRRIDPKIESYAGRAPLPRAPRAAPESTETPFIVGLIPYFELLEKEDREKAGRLAARMQQTLGESVLLADGTILDSLGARFVATLPSPDGALAALRQAALQIAEQNATAPEGEILEATVLAHSGAITLGPGSPAGPALEQAARILASMEPGQMLLTAPVAAATGVGKEAPPLGTAEGVALHAVPPEAAPEPAPEAEAPAGTAAAAPPRRGSKRAIAAIAAVAAIFVVAIAAIVFWPREKEAAPVAAAPASTAAPADPRPQLVLEPFAVDGNDPEIVARAAALEEAVRAMLASSPGLRLLDQPASQAARRYGSRSVPGGTKDQITVYSLAGGAGESGPLSITDPAAAATIASWIARSAGVAPERIETSNPEALAAFVDSLVEKRSGSPERAAVAIRKALVSDPEFLPVARAAVSILSTVGDRAGAVAAAERVVRLDSKDAATRRQLVAWLRASGDEVRAIPHAAAVVASGDDDVEIITFLARQALSAGDSGTFQNLVGRLQRTSDRTRIPLHAADATAARGQLAVAVQQYYELEPRERQNPFLSLKIARIDVLRHSIPAAELELEKLRLLDSTYAAEILQAYLAAEKRNAAGAAEALARAAIAPNRGPDFHTIEAEVYAILSDHRGVLAALRRAIDAREPTFAYILSNPVFAYLRDEPEYAPMRATMEARQQELRAALQAVR